MNKKPILFFGMIITGLITLGIAAVLIQPREIVSAKRDTQTLATKIPIEQNFADMTEDEIIAYAEELTAKSNEVYLTAGWLHIKQESESFNKKQMYMQDGTPVPMKWVTDEWFLLDNDGFVTQSVSYSDTGEQATTSIAVFQNGEIENLTFTDIHFQQEKYEMSFLGYNFAGSARKYQSENALSISEEVLDDEVLIVFEMRSISDELITLELGDAAQEISGLLKNYSYLKSSGLPHSLEEWYVLPNGEEQLKKVTTFLLFEKVDIPPAEMMQYFDDGDVQ